MTPDELEARSIKYNIARIVRLSSGNFALFDPWTNEGLYPLHIGTIEEIAPLIPTSNEVIEYLADNHESRHASIGSGGSDLLVALGLSRPQPLAEPIRRRV